MAQSNYQEPIEQKDLELGKKIHEEASLSELGKKETVPVPESPEEAGAEKNEEKISEKIETARQAIGIQQVSSGSNITDDAHAVSQIEEFEKKVEKLVEMAIQKGPEHAIKVARQMDKSKNPAEADNFTLDEIHDRMMEDELRKKLMEKGLLKEL